MLTKMRDSKGFTLVELMIVVAIIGILAAVAIPYYQRYVAKARVQQLVIPALHGIINGVTTYYGLKDGFPSDLTKYMEEGDTTCFQAGTWGTNNSGASFLVTLRSTAASCKPLAKLAIPGSSNRTFTLKAVKSAGKSLIWKYSGDLAEELGME